ATEFRPRRGQSSKSVIVSAIFRRSPHGTKGLSAPPALAFLSPPRWPRPPLAGTRSQLEQPIDLHDEPAVLERRESGHTRPSAFREDDEELAAGPVLPAEARVGAEGIDARVVLDEDAREHARRDRRRDPRAQEARSKRPLWQVDPVD